MMAKTLNIVMRKCSDDDEDDDNDSEDFSSGKFYLFIFRYSFFLLLFFFFLILKSICLKLASVQFSSVAQSCLTLSPHGLKHARSPCPSATPGVYSDSRP